MKFPRCVVERISMKYGRNLGAFGTKERNEIWAEVGRNSGLRQAGAKAGHVVRISAEEADSDQTSDRSSRAAGTMPRWPCD